MAKRSAPKKAAPILPDLVEISGRVASNEKRFDSNAVTHTYTVYEVKRFEVHHASEGTNGASSFGGIAHCVCRTREHAEKIAQALAESHNKGEL